MKRFMTTSAAALLMALCAALNAQTFETGYFLDNNSYAFRYNPAMHCERSFLGAIIGNVDVFSGSNTGVSSFFFPVNGKLVNGFNKQVSAQEFLGRLSPVSTVNANFGFSLATIGFWNRKHTGYNVIDINVKGYTEGNVPRDLFEFLKVGSADKTFDIVGTDVTANLYTEIAYGYSRHISSWKVGARAKLLLGLGQARFRADHLRASNQGGRIYVDSDASLMLAQNGLEVPLKEDGSYDFDKLRYNSSATNVPGIGFGFDFGATFEPVKGLVTSLSILDLGGISWTYNINGLANNTLDLVDLSSTDPDVKDRFQELLKVMPAGETSGFAMLPFTLNAGARYAMPFYNKLTAGLSFTYRNMVNPYFSGRLGVTVTPKDWFSFVASYGYGTFGSSVGAAFSISGGSFNFYAGIETYVGEMMADALLPTGKFKTALNLGINFRL